MSRISEAPRRRRGRAATKKRTITEIRDSKQTGEKMVYTSVLDYTSAKWAEAAGVDVCVVGDSLAMTATATQYDSRQRWT
jgi:ketopantoate hydroxymethyltransferase